MLYLGVVFKSGVKISINVASRISKFMGTICSVLRVKMVGFEDLYVSVVVTKCIPTLLYGICSLHLSSMSLSIAYQLYWTQRFVGNLDMGSMNRWEGCC